MKKTTRVLLTLSMLASVHHGIKATRYLNYDRIIQVIAKLKALGKNTDKVEAFEKNFKNSYVTSWVLLPREYNKLSVLMVELLDTADKKSATQQETMLQVLEMIDDELKGLLNRHGYRKDLVALSYKTSDLRVNLARNSTINPLYLAELKRSAQDILAESLLNESTSESIEKRVKDHMRKLKEKETQKEQKKSQTEQNPHEGTDRKP
jgi:hypothetical protein